jgi:di/tricarboxylate transporter
MSLFFILNSEISKQRKIIIAISISLIFLVILGYGTTQNFIKTDLDWNGFWLGFTAFAFQLRLDGLIVVFLLPLTIGLFIKSKTNKYSTSILILIGGILLISPITSGFLNETNQPYRYLSLVVFFAVGVGLLFSKVKITDNE